MIGRSGFGGDQRGFPEHQPALGRSASDSHPESGTAVRLNVERRSAHRILGPPTIDWAKHLGNPTIRKYGVAFLLFNHEMADQLLDAARFVQGMNGMSARRTNELLKSLGIQANRERPVRDRGRD